MAMSELGLGRAAMATVCSVIGMPPPTAQSGWDMHSKNISNALESILEEECSNSAKKLRQYLQDDNSGMQDDDAIIDVVVSYDGTWHHRGFKSSQGVGIVISIDTGEILDAEVVSKTCEICQRSTLDRKSAEFESWEQKHKESGQCYCNFDGPSTGMETAAAKAIWSRSIAKHKMRYVAMLGDGDNKTLQSLNELQPYGQMKITKLECVNHIHKRMGTGLRNLLKSNPNIRGGSGGLTAQMITKLSSYYRKHIMDHQTSSKDPVVIQESVKKMKINILASLHHSVKNDDPAEQHKFCMDRAVQWCSYKKSLNSPQTSTSTKKQKKDYKLPSSYLSHMLPLYNRLSDDSLLKRCTAGPTQNQNEAFNATLWRRCPKERYFGTGTVRRALALSVLCWNGGRQSLTRVLEKLGFEANVYSSEAFISKDKHRLSHSRRIADQKVKKRKLTKESLTGDYVPGGY